MIEKGILELLEALEILEEQNIDYEAKIAGNIDVANRKHFLTIIKNLKFTEYLGVVKGERKKELLKWSNVFVLPTYYKMEGQPISIIEAMATNNVIITTKLDGIMDIIREIRDFVENECKKPSSKYGYDPFTFHFVPMVNHAEVLADELGGDKEIILIAAWLHDIGSIIYGRKDHHITSSKIAEEKLKELDYPQDKIEQVKECILSHRGSQKIKSESLEAQIIIEADTLSAFNDISGLFQCAFVYEKLPRTEAKKSVIQKLENKWNQLQFEKSKIIVKPKYEAIMMLLK